MVKITDMKELDSIYKELKELQDRVGDAVELSGDNELNTDVDIYAKIGDVMELIDSLKEELKVK